MPDRKQRSLVSTRLTSAPSNRESASLAHLAGMAVHYATYQEPSARSYFFASGGNSR
jgi:hypothetical protein